MPKPADVVELYPSFPQSAGLNSLKRALENRVNKQIPRSNLVKMTEFVLSSILSFVKNFVST